MRIVLCLVAGLCSTSFHLNAQPSAGSSDNLQIFYTGDLFGYPRVPDLQRLCEVPGSIPKLYKRSPSCDKAISSDPESLPGKVLIRILQSNRPANGANTATLTLGLGDNFAMNYFSRVAVVADANRGIRLVPKDQLAYDSEAQGWRDIENLNRLTSKPTSSAGAIAKQVETRLANAEKGGRSTVDHDNVADFFLKAQYDALVPGKHDFYYGPERLRQLARYMAAGRNGASVLMLGANLVVRTTDTNETAKQHESIRKRSRPYWIVDKKTDGNKEIVVAENPMSWSLPDGVLPWNRKFVLNNAYLQTGPQFTGGAKLYKVPVGDIDGALTACTDLAGPARQASGQAVFSMPDPNVLLEAERTYAVCTVRDGESQSFCKTFNVESPLLQYSEVVAREDRKGRAYVFSGNQIQESLSAIDPDNPDRDCLFDPNAASRGCIAPYLYRPESNTVVFGVVETGLEKRIGALNASWMNEQHELRHSSARHRSSHCPDAATRLLPRAGTLQVRYALRADGAHAARRRPSPESRPTRQEDSDDARPLTS